MKRVLDELKSLLGSMLTSACFVFGFIGLWVPCIYLASFVAG